MDVNCFFFLVKIAGDGTRWKLEMISELNFHLYRVLMQTGR